MAISLPFFPGYGTSDNMFRVKLPHTSVDQLSLSFCMWSQSVLRMRINTITYYS